jgi:hypothetical protein
MASRFILPFADVGLGIKPSSGARLFFYETGTNTFRNTFTDQAATTPNANPVIADSNGVFSNIFIDGTYKVILQNTNSTQIWEADPVVSLVSVSNEINILDNTSLIAASGLDIGAKLLCPRYSNGGELVDGLFYVIVAGGTGTADGGSFFDLDNDNQAQLIQPIKVNAKHWGCVGLGNSDDTSPLQIAIDYAYDNEKSTSIPSGTYNFTALTIRCPQTAGFYDRPRAKITGQGVGNTVLQHTGTGTAVNVIGENDISNAAFGAIFEYLSIKKSTASATATTNGIEFQRGSGYIIDNCSLEGGINAIYVPTDIWLSKFTNIKISGSPSYGINMAGSGTSNYFDQIYVTFSTVSAYKLAGSYSVIGALAADNCSGDSVYNFNFFSGSAGSLGSETPDVTTVVDCNQSELFVGHINIFNAEVSATKGKPINCTAGAIICSTLTVFDSVAAGDVAQQLYSQTDGYVDLKYVDTNWSFNSQWGNSADNNGFAIYSNKNSPVALRQAGARAYLGLDRRGQGRATIDDGGIVHSNAIFLDCLGSPRYTSDGTDRRFQVGATIGDWFVEGSPNVNLVAGYAATASSSDLSAVAPKAIPLILSGTTGARPTVPTDGLRIGLSYFDTTLGLPIWWTGSGWVDATGVSA